MRIHPNTESDLILSESFLIQPYSGTCESGGRGEKWQSEAGRWGEEMWKGELDLRTSASVRGGESITRLVAPGNLVRD